MSVTPSELRVRRVAAAAVSSNGCSIRSGCSSTRRRTPNSGSSGFIWSRGDDALPSAVFSDRTKASFAKPLLAALRAPTRHNHIPVSDGNIKLASGPTSGIPMMTLAINDQRLTEPTERRAARLSFGAPRYRIHLETLARAADHRSDSGAATHADELHPLFRRSAGGLTPKAFVLALHPRSHQRPAAQLCRATRCRTRTPASRVLGRLHAVRSPSKAMSPGYSEEQQHRRDPALRIAPFAIRHRDRGGGCGRGLAGLAFADPGEDEQASFADMKRRWPNTEPVRRPRAQSKYHATHIRHENVAGEPAAPRGLDQGSDFEVRVWETLLKIPISRAICCSEDIASKIKTKASRAAVRRSDIIRYRSWCPAIAHSAKAAR